MGIKQLLFLDTLRRTQTGGSREKRQQMTSRLILP
jgi:hypothetical protein